MFCAFEGPPKIVRLHGLGEVILPGHTEFDPLITRFPSNTGTRAFIRIRLTRISNSCGYAVPVLDFQKDRDVLDQWIETKKPEEIEQYRKDHNQHSIDDLPAIDPP